MDIITAWLILGSLSFAWHNIYLWDCASDEFKKEITSFHFFVGAVIGFSLILYVVISIKIRVVIDLHKWKKENGFI